MRRTLIDERLVDINRKDRRACTHCVLMDGEIEYLTRIAETNSKRMLEQLRRQRSSLRCLINNMPAGAVLLDSELRVLDANKTYARYFDRSARWHTGAHLSEVLPLAEESGIVSMLRQALRTNRPVSVKGFRYEGFSQGVTYWNGTAIPVVMASENGDISGVAMVVTDVTEEMRTQEQIQEVYLREHAVAEKLQMSFLPGDLPAIEGFEIAERYRPGLDEALVGGDFYDVFRLSDHEYGIVMADVAGKGLKAAVYTAMTKYMLRAYALEEGAPELALTRLNEALSACTPAEVFVTLVYGVVDTESGTFAYANAGHEQPVYYGKQDQFVTTLDVTGRALALAKGAIYATQTVRMEPGDVLMLYTDGITDAGWGANRLGQDRLLAMLASGIRSPVSELADFVLNNALEFASGEMGDDAARLIIRMEEEEQ